MPGRPVEQRGGGARVGQDGQARRAAAGESRELLSSAPGLLDAYDKWIDNPRLARGSDPVTAGSRQ
eukprot:7458574-Pyramimonas_sp.AAC.1